MELLQSFAAYLGMAATSHRRYWDELESVQWATSEIFPELGSDLESMKTCLEKKSTLCFLASEFTGQKYSSEFYVKIMIKLINGLEAYKVDFSGLVSDVTGLTHMSQAMRQDVDELQIEVEKIQARLDAVEDRQDLIEERQDLVENEISLLQTDHDTMKCTQDDMQQQLAAVKQQLFKAVHILRSSGIIMEDID
jgi:chromosome segregation ATPase